MKKKMMKNMETYGGQENPGYHPPTGNAGVKAFGRGSTTHNPLSVPTKGSQIGPASEFGNSADRSKVKAMQKEQEANESLRGYGC